MANTEQALTRGKIEKIAGSCMESGRFHLFMAKIDDALTAASAEAQPSQEPAEGDLKRITHERDALAEAIRDAAVSAGICRADAHLTGPHLLMLCADMANCITASAPQPSAPVAQAERHVLMDDDIRAHAKKYCEFDMKTRTYNILATNLKKIS